MRSTCGFQTSEQRSSGRFVGKLEATRRTDEPRGAASHRDVCLQNYRRVVVRQERHAENFLPMLHLASALLLLRHLGDEFYSLLTVHWNLSHKCLAFDLCRSSTQFPVSRCVGIEGKGHHTSPTCNNRGGIAS